MGGFLTGVGGRAPGLPQQHVMLSLSKHEFVIPHLKRVRVINKKGGAT
jgi:hypothetical protein